MSGELATVNTGRALIAAGAIEQEGEQRRLLGEYVRTQMVEGTDFGVIPNTKNRTLLKPGAEKLTQLFRCVPRYTVEGMVENYETGLFTYRFRCEIVTLADGVTVAEGVGSCSTFESRYRWRSANRKCPACGKETIIKQKEEKGGNWLCLGNDKGGCWSKFDKADPGITGQQTGRVQNPDLIDAVNTVLKIAKKRALVDAAISLARCSDIFTQDVEDFAGDHPGPSRPAAQPPAFDGAGFMRSFVPRVEAAATRLDHDTLAAEFNGVAQQLDDGQYQHGLKHLEDAWARVTAKHPASA